MSYRLAGIGLLSTLVALAAFGSATAADAVNWRTHLDAAKIEAGQSNRLLLLHFWTTSCGPCRALDKNVYSQPHVGGALEADFVPVKINAEVSPAVTNAYRITRVPTDIIITSQGSLVAALECPRTPDEYLAQLSNLAAHHRAQTGGENAAEHEAPVQTAYAGLQVRPHTPTAATQTSNAATHEPPVAAPAQVNNPWANQTASPASDAAAVAGPQLPANAMPQSYRQAPTNSAPSQPQTIADSLPAGSPPLGFDGFCSVTLKHGQPQRWVMGNAAYGAVHRGRTYLFVGEQQRQQFLANPDAYAPVLSGLDPVRMLDDGQSVEGSRSQGFSYLGNFYLFSSAETKAKFAAEPALYAKQVRQAMNQLDAAAGGQTRR